MGEWKGPFDAMELDGDHSRHHHQSPVVGWLRKAGAAVHYIEEKESFAIWQILLILPTLDDGLDL